MKVIKYNVFSTDLGDCFLCVTESDEICFLDLAVSEIKKNELEKSLEKLHKRFPQTIVEKGEVKYMKEIQAACLGKEIEKLPLYLKGSPFYTRVWEVLQEIPRGACLSYAEVATKAGNPKAVRAVATACSSNPIPILVPCHRVIRSGGSLGGYGYGLEKKQRILQSEGYYMIQNK